ncbi:hypothetical protein BRC68_17505 [Halobacteriales archaeon QH_6_64_20]|nr:MAG: hypothetical protein BRC68_17505 [Halobacteriales archaeon QH_6_64_20]
MNAPRGPDRIKREHTVANELTSHHYCERDQCDHPRSPPRDFRSKLSGSGRFDAAQSSRRERVETFDRERVETHTVADKSVLDNEGT